MSANRVQSPRQRVAGGKKAKLQQWLNLIAYNLPAGSCVQPQYFDILLSQLEASQLGHVPSHPEGAVLHKVRRICSPRDGILY